MSMHNPPHPGEFIEATYMEPFALSCRFLATRLDVSASTLNRILKLKSGVSPEMALRRSKALGRSPESWLAMQDAYNLWVVRKQVKLEGVRPVNLSNRPSLEFFPHVICGVTVRNDLIDVGRYSTSAHPMQVVSRHIGKRKVHFEAPPADRMSSEMDGFIQWFNQTAPTGKQPLSALIRSGIAHLYFVSSHPFEYGNGRVGRAISEKALSQNLEQPTLIALARTIEAKRKDYYAALERANRNVEITEWLHYFAETILEAQAYTIQCVDFLIEKARFFNRLGAQLNARQQKVLARMFAEGLEGFKGGFSADNYISIAKTFASTATRDLKALVEKGALSRIGELKHTRYHLNLLSLQS